MNFSREKILETARALIELDCIEDVLSIDCRPAFVDCDFHTVSVFVVVPQSFAFSVEDKTRIFEVLLENLPTLEPKLIFVYDNLGRKLSSIKEDGEIPMMTGFCGE